MIKYKNKLHVALLKLEFVTHLLGPKSSREIYLYSCTEKIYGLQKKKIITGIESSETD
jgi:hypothetical protein